VSVDALAGRRRGGVWGALLALGGGALASTLAIDLGAASAPADGEAAPPRGGA
jgi:hypothetical protein